MRKYFIIYTTYSNYETGPNETGGSFRVIIPVKDMILPEDYSSCVDYVLLNTGLITPDMSKEEIKNIGIDTCSKTLSQPIFSPVTAYRDKYHGMSTKKISEFLDFKEDFVQYTLEQVKDLNNPKPKNPNPAVEPSAVQADFGSAAVLAQCASGEVEEKPTTKFIKIFNKKNTTIANLCELLPEYYIQEGNRARRKGSENAAGISLLTDKDDPRFVSSHNGDPMGRNLYRLFDALFVLKFKSNYSDTFNYIINHKSKFKMEEQEIKLISQEETNQSNQSNQENLETNETKVAKFAEFCKSDEGSFKQMVYDGFEISMGYPPKEQKEKEYLLNGEDMKLFPRGEVTLIYGLPGCGKTTFMNAFAKALVKGENFANQPTNPRGGRVGLVTTESSLAEYSRVLDPDTTLEQRKKFINVDLSRSHKYSALSEFLSGLAKHGEKIELIVVDCATGIHTHKSLNEDQGAEELYQIIKSWASATKNNPAVVLIHHCNKDKETSEDDIFRVSGSIKMTSEPRCVLSYRKVGNGIIALKKVKDNTFTGSSDEQEQDSQTKYLKMLENYQYEITDYTPTMGWKNLTNNQGQVKTVLDKYNSLELNEKVEKIRSFRSQNTNEKSYNPINFIIYLGKEWGLELPQTETVRKCCKDKFSDILTEIEKDLVAYKDPQLPATLPTYPTDRQACQVAA